EGFPQDLLGSSLPRRAGAVRPRAQLRAGDHPAVEEDGVGGRPGPDLERAVLLGEKGGSKPLGNGCRTRDRVHGPPSSARSARAPRSAAGLLARLMAVLP